MKTLIDEILKWPVIVQGALGSALFSAILAVCAWSARTIATSFRGFSRVKRLDMLRNEALRYEGLASNNPATSALTLVLLVYTAIRELVKALSVISLGFIFGSIVPILETVGFVMALYYLILAADAVRDTTRDVDPRERAKELEKLIAKLEAET
jgi:hypothetical protein